MINTDRIRQLMEQKDLNCAKLAEKTGVTEAMVSYILRNLRNPSIGWVVNASKALGCSIDEIIIK